MNTEIISDATAAKVESVLSTIASKLGQGVDHFYPIFVRQQAIEGISSVAAWLLVTTIAVVIFTWGLKIGNRQKWQEEFPCFPMVLGGGLLSFACVMVGVLAIGEATSKIFNPEYHAVKAIMELVK